MREPDPWRRRPHHPEKEVVGPSPSREGSPGRHATTGMLGRPPMFDGGGVREVEKGDETGARWWSTVVVCVSRDRNEVYMSTFSSIGMRLCTRYRMILQN
jgi:hypothetical protein